MSGTPITSKQESFVKSLLLRVKNTNNLNHAQDLILRGFKRDGNITKDEASYLISGLLDCDKQPRGEMAKPGYYVMTDGTYVVVVENRDKTATYAKRLEVKKAKGQRAKARWVYAPGVGYAVAQMTPMTMDEAAKFGHLNGVCFVCCKALTDPKSVKAGIGPVCAKRIRR